VGEFQEAMQIGESPADLSSFQMLWDSLNRAVLALRTFKQGPVGFTGIIFRAKHFCPFAGTQIRGANAFIPWGNYNLPAADIPSFQAHAELITTMLHPSLELACSRLADAMTRSNPRDSILDASIGLEAILLTTTGDEEKYKGENRYRFALNYSSLFEGKESRHASFYEARNLYDLRSTIAHGGDIASEKARKILALIKQHGDKASDKACEMLRLVIHRFLPQGSRPPYVSPDYWPKLYFQMT